MQSVSHDYRLLSPLMDSIETLYYYVSDDYDEHSINALIPMTFPRSFENTVNVFADNGHYFNVSYTDSAPPKKVRVKDNKKDVVVVCVSGGKDSLATTLYYIEHGYDVRLFHLKGINKCYPDEHRAIENAAEYLKLPLCEWEVKLHGNHCYVEHPLKNWILMNAALTYAVTEVGTLNVAVGNFTTNYLIDNKFEVCAGDTTEFWALYEDIIHAVLPKFKVMIALRDVRESLAFFEKRPELLAISQSCIGTYRFKEYRGNLIRKKYTYPLLPHRCGCCWKCALEYIYYADRDVFEFNEDYYKHCLKILYDTMKADNNWNEYTIEDVWCNFMIHNDMENSKLENIWAVNVKGLR